MLFGIISLGLSSLWPCFYDHFTCCCGEYTKEMLQEIHVYKRISESFDWIYCEPFLSASNLNKAH